MASKRKIAAWGVAGIVALGIIGSWGDTEETTSTDTASTPSASESLSTPTSPDEAVSPTTAPTPGVRHDAAATVTPAAGDADSAHSTYVNGTYGHGPAALVTVLNAARESIEAADTQTARGALVPVTGVTDGDTIKVRLDGVTERVRVIGIDTPELRGDECYAQRAASRMQSLVQSRSVYLEADPTQDDRDRYDRLLRHVFTKDGTNVAQTLIAEGLGKEYTYSAAYRYQSEYRDAERAAQQGNLGLWGACPSAAPNQPQRVAGPAEQPRKQNSAPTKAAPKSTPKPAPKQEQPAGECTIKGNINSEGEKIYHVPGGRSYEKTKISPEKGERWFCSRSEAEAAGWRAARG